MEIKVKAELYSDLLPYFRDRGFSPHEVGTTLGIYQVGVSHLLNGKVSRFSVGQLLNVARKLNLRAQVKLTKPYDG